MGLRILLVLAAFSLVLGCSGSKPPATDGKIADGTGKNTDGNGQPRRAEPPDTQIERPPYEPPISEKRPLSELSDDELIQCLGHADRGKRQQAAERLYDRGPEIVSKLIGALDDENVHVRAGAVYALGLFGPDAEAAVPRLKELQTEDHREEVRDAVPFVLDAIHGR